MRFILPVLLVVAALFAVSVDAAPVPSSASCEIVSYNVVSQGLVNKVTVTYGASVDPVDGGTECYCTLKSWVGGTWTQTTRWFYGRDVKGEHTEVFYVPCWYEEGLITVGANNDEASATDEQGFIY